MDHIQKFLPINLFKFASVFTLLLLNFNTPTFAAITGPWSITSFTNAQASSNIGAGDGLLTVSTQTTATAGGGTLTLPTTSNPATMGGFAFAYSEPGIVGSPSLRYRFGYGFGCNGTATWRITFNRPVFNPVLHLDRLGGTRGGIAEGAVHTFTQPLTQLAGVTHFQVNPNSVHRQLTGASSGNGECSTSASGGTSCGSIRVNGAITGPLDIAFTQIGPVCGTGDQLEIIVSVPQDLGDAPGSYGGGVHSIRNAAPADGGALYLGTTPPDDEPDSQTSANSSGDGADEDGLAPLQLYQPLGGMTCTGSNGTYTTQANEYCAVVTATNTTNSPAQLVGWLDINVNGSFEVSERSVTAPGAAHPDDDGTFVTGNVPANSGTNNYVLVWTGLGNDNHQTQSPPFQSANQTHSRYRITTDSSFFSDTSPQPTGPVLDGEIEDHLVAFGVLPVTLSHVSNSLSGNYLEVDWSTSSELFNIGFQLWGLDGMDGKWEKLHNWLVKSGSGNAVEPQSYRKRVKLPGSMKQLTAVGISSVDSDGSEHYYGPFELGQTYGALSNLEPIAWNKVRDEVDAQMAAKGYAKDKVNGYRKITTPSGTGPAALDTNEVVEFTVSADGMYRITSGELLAAGVDWRDVANGEIAVLNQTGMPIQRHVLAKGLGKGQKKTLGQAGEIYFYGAAPKGSAGLYTDRSVYRLVLDRYQALTVPKQKKQGVNAGLLTSYREESIVEQDKLYILNSKADDPWLNSVVVSYSNLPYGVSNLVSTADDVILEQGVELIIGAARSSELNPIDGDGDGVQDPEHIMQGAVLDANGKVVWLDEREETGSGQWEERFSLPDGIELDASVLTGVVFKAGAGYGLSEVHLDYMGLSYARPLQSKPDELHLHFTAPNQGESGYEALVSDTGWPWVFATDGANLVRILPEHVVKETGSGGEQYRRVKFAALLGQSISAEPLRYWVSGRSGYLTVEALTSRSIRSMTSVLGEAAGANYILIAHPSFLATAPNGRDYLAEYADYKRNHGYTVSIVNYLDIVDTFGGGQPGPHGLTEYLSQVESQGDLVAVLLVGGSVYDHTDKLATGAMTFIPGHYGNSNHSKYTVSDVPYVTADNGELFATIGRWPARSLSDVQLMVDKSIAWSSKNHSNGEALLIAEHTVAGEGIDFANAVENLQPSLPAGWTMNKVYIDEILASNPQYTLTQALNQGRSEILAHLNNTPDVVMFNGHGTTSQLSNNGLFKSQHVSQITAKGAEVWLPLSCYVTYYESTHVNTLAHQLLFSGNAVAISGAMLLSDQSENMQTGEAILNAAVNQGSSLGEAVNLHKAAQNNTQLTINWAVLGDPTISLEP